MTYYTLVSIAFLFHPPSKVYYVRNTSLLDSTVNPLSKYTYLTNPYKNKVNWQLGSFTKM
jgi:hypothetical protein